jgi:hypothetical protein
MFIHQPNDLASGKVKTKVISLSARLIFEHNTLAHQIFLSYTHKINNQAN